MSNVTIQFAIQIIIGIISGIISGVLVTKYYKIQDNKRQISKYFRELESYVGKIARVLPMNMIGVKFRDENYNSRIEKLDILTSSEYPYLDKELGEKLLAKYCPLKYYSFLEAFNISYSNLKKYLACFRIMDSIDECKKTYELLYAEEEGKRTDEWQDAVREIKNIHDELYVRLTILALPLEINFSTPDPKTAYTKFRFQFDNLFAEWADLREKLHEANISN